MTGLLSALGGLLQLNNFDGISNVANAVASQRGTSVDQSFQKTFAEIDYRIQRQELHRDDIRDLVGVTVGRMDVFLVVGTLLLTFCIGWFSDNSVIDGPTPTWFKTLFLISDFAAVGYLILCVWLAMHASIASHSLGARLLTSYARLSIPTRSQLDNIKRPLFPVIENLVNAGRKLGVLQSEPTSVVGPERRGRTERQSSVTGRVSGTSSVSDWVEEDAIAKEALDEGSDEWHFRRFLRIQSKWLSYDSYSRVCMILGMNQMLHALSYYIVGTLIHAGVVSAAVFSFFGIKFLVILLMKLDLAGTPGMKDHLLLWFFTIMPSAFAAFVLWSPIELDLEEKSLLATPCFVLHMFWLLYLSFQIEPVPSGEFELLLPRRLRTVGYLNIIELKQRELAAEFRKAKLRDCIERLKASCSELEHHLREVMDDEAASGTVSSGRRCNDRRLLELSAYLETALAQARYAHAGSCLQVDEDVDSASRLMDRVALWKRAPEILSMLEALRERDVHEWVKPEDQVALERTYTDFLRQCHEMDLGIASTVADSSASTSSHRQRASSRGKSSLAGLVALRVNPDGATPMVVRVDAPTDFGETSIWIDAQSHEVLQEQPIAMRSVSVNQALRVEMPAWNNAAARAGRRVERGATELSWRSSQQAFDVNCASAPDVESIAIEALTPKDATPPDNLPGFTVMRFTRAAVFFWFMATMLHVVTAYYQWYRKRHDKKPSTSSFAAMDVVWPEPASLFQVASMHCNDSHVLLSDRFWLYASEWVTESSLAPLVKVMASDVVTMTCDSRGCDVVTLASYSNALWQWAPIAAPFGSDRLGMLLPAQPEWHLTTAAWGRCSATRCSEAWLAGWDGFEIVVIKLRPEVSDMARLQEVHRFTLYPGLVNCVENCSMAAKYTEVRSLQLASGAGMLFVLLESGVVDFWDLASGSFLEQWDAIGTVAACHDGSGRMLLARQASQGPILEWAPEPAFISKDARLSW